MSLQVVFIAISSLMTVFFSYITVTHCSIIYEVDSYKEDKIVSILSAIITIISIILLATSIFYPEVLPTLVEGMKFSLKHPVMV